ncbi:hypothetical protein ACP70R_000560 [Stipagrostis hirtigluma subsp. patula]
MACTSRRNYGVWAKLYLQRHTRSIKTKERRWPRQFFFSSSSKRTLTSSQASSCPYSTHRKKKQLSAICYRISDRRGHPFQNVCSTQFLHTSRRPKRT